MPKSYFLITEPGGEDTFLLVPELRKNVIGFDRFIPESAEDTKQLFEKLDKCCKEAKEMYEKGEIEVEKNNSFVEDLGRGKQVEQMLLNKLKSKYPSAAIIDKFKGYDIWIPEIHKSIEVKADEKSNYTGNIGFMWNIPKFSSKANNL